MKSHKVWIFCTVVSIILSIATMCKWQSMYSEAMKQNRELKWELEETKYNLKKSELSNTMLKEIVNSSTITITTLNKRLDSYSKLINVNPISTLTQDEVLLLAKTAQAEAGSYSKHSESQKMVIKTILNRLRSKDFPDTIHDVIYDRTNGVQFSVAYDGSLNKVVLEPETLLNTYEVLMFGYDLPEEVQYFYASYLKESYWVRKLRVYKEVQGTVFSYNYK